MMTMMPQGRERGESESEENAHFEHSSLSLVQVRVTLDGQNGSIDFMVDAAIPSRDERDWTVGHPENNH